MKKKPELTIKKPSQERDKPTDFIEWISSKPKAWWVAQIQSLVVKHSTPSKDPWHKKAEPEKMIVDLARLVAKTTFRKGERFDGNMRMAAVLSYVLALWYLRLSRAKAYDPRRPVKHRQAALVSRFAYATALFLAVTDESEDYKYFPGQNWETPFSDHPTDGYFI